MKQLIVLALCAALAWTFLKLFPNGESNPLEATTNVIEGSGSSAPDPIASGTPGNLAELGPADRPGAAGGTAAGQAGPNLFDPVDAAVAEDLSLIHI